MGHRHWHGCGPRGRFEFNIPEALMAMRGGRGGSWGPFHFDFGDGSEGSGRRGPGSRRPNRPCLRRISGQPRQTRLVRSYILPGCEKNLQSLVTAVGANFGCADRGAQGHGHLGKGETVQFVQENGLPLFDG